MAPGILSGYWADKEPVSLRKDFQVGVGLLFDIVYVWCLE